jgi:heavy metal translocating P-type ATPase
MPHRTHPAGLFVTFAPGSVGRVACASNDDDGTVAPPAPLTKVRIRVSKPQMSTVGFLGSLVAVTAGGVLVLLGDDQLAGVVWAAATAVVAVRLAVAIVADLLQRRAGVDVIALLAMAGALALGQFLAGAVIAVMLTGGQALEDYASGRARRELTALLAGAPRVAHRVRDDRVEAVDVAEVVPGELLLVRSGEAVPVDGVVVDSGALFDESALTGESRPVPRHSHAHVGSGAVNAGTPVKVRAVATADDSTYAGIVRLVRDAAAARTPFTRLADRYALAFVPLTLLVAGGAWVASGDPVRALAVLVVATPCPLILAAPIALVSGVSVAARRGVIVKGAGALEQLAAATSVVFDKTGTLTAGAPRVAEIVAVPGVTSAELVRLAASLEQASSHVVAEAIVGAACDRGLALSFPAQVEERPGVGITGVVGGRRVRLGSAGWVTAQTSLPMPVAAVQRRARLEGASVVLVAFDDDVVVVMVLDDPIRPESGRVVRSLRAAGVAHVAMLTGDDHVIAEVVASALGLDEARSELGPGEKVAAVAELSASATGLTAMVGDGVNDAPALARADVGLAIGAGTDVAIESAGVVLASSDPRAVVSTIELSAAAYRKMIQNLVWAAGYNVLAIPLAAGVLTFAGFTLSPAVGAILMSLSTIVVAANAQLLRRLTL